MQNLYNTSASHQSPITASSYVCVGIYDMGCRFGNVIMILVTGLMTFLGSVLSCVWYNFGLYLVNEHMKGGLQRHDSRHNITLDTKMPDSVFGFHVSFDMLDALSVTQRNALLDRFIADAIEANGLQFGGGGAATWAGFVEPERLDNPITEPQRQSVIDWLNDELFVINHTVSPMLDLNNDDECQPFLNK